MTHVHDFSHEHLTTFNQGEWVPTFWFKSIPGEHIRVHTDLVVRTQPLLAPPYAKVRASVRYYAVPIRTIWDDFTSFRTGGSTGEFTAEHPYALSPTDGYGVGSLPHYLGVSPVAEDLRWNVLVARAYNKIWNDFIRDKDLQPERVISKASGLDTTTDLSLANVCWEKNNFTTARPTPQRGDPVSIPLTGNSPVKSDYNSGANSTVIVNQVAGPDEDKVYINTSTPAASAFYADNSDVTAVDIDDLRLATAVQTWKTKLSQFVPGGSMSEFLRLFGVNIPDPYLDMPIRLGGGESTIQFSEVLQTAEGTDPVGELRGHGIGTLRSRRASWHCKEDCIVIGFVSVKPKTVYMDAMQRSFFDTSKWDYYIPALQNLGQQPVYNKEVDATHASPDGIFGYNDQNYWYRRQESRVSGEFYDSLAFWHMGIKYETDPALNADFVKATPTDRIYAAGGAQHQLQVRIWNNIKRKNKILPFGMPSFK